VQGLYFLPFFVISCPEFYTGRNEFKHVFNLLEHAKCAGRLTLCLPIGQYLFALMWQVHVLITWKADDMELVVHLPSTETKTLPVCSHKQFYMLGH
jgi:hypothetical protein